MLIAHGCLFNICLWCSCSSSQLAIPESPLPPPYLETAQTLRRRVEWLIMDELISVSREATPITPPLLQAVAAHAQASHRAPTCFAEPISLKFVYSSDRSMQHFIAVSLPLVLPLAQSAKLGCKFLVSQ